MQGEAGSLDLNVFEWNLVIGKYSPLQNVGYNMVRMCVCVCVCMFVFGCVCVYITCLEREGEEAMSTCVY